MRIKIKLDTRKNVLNNDGYPIVYYMTKDSKEKTIRTGYRSQKKHWDAANALPLNKHPNCIAILNYLERKKITVGKILDDSKYRPVGFIEAEQRLKGYDTDVFYEMGKTIKGSRTYDIALNSFNKYYPNYTFSSITQQVVKQYMDILISMPVNGKERSPNGVISYLNTLTAIWNKLGKPNNPFSGIRPKARKTQNKALTIEDLRAVRDNDYKKHSNSKAGGIKNYLNYFMLCFYLGGMDLGDLVRMRYDRNVINGRLEFRRSKGGTDCFVSNKIFPEAWAILEQYDCSPYLIPLAKDSVYKNFIPNLSRVLPSVKDKLGLTKIPYSKAARYSFITQGQNILVDERIMIQLVGHSENSTHSVYKDAFPYHVIDKAHGEILRLL